MIPENPNPLKLALGDYVLLKQGEGTNYVPKFMRNIWVPVDGFEYHGRPYTVTVGHRRIYQRPDSRSTTGRHRPIFPENVALVKRREKDEP